MNVRKIFLLWSDFVPHNAFISCKTWAGIVVLHIKRCVLALYTSYALVPAFFVGIAEYYGIMPPIGNVLVLAALVYLMRSSVQLKNKSYAKAFLSPELVVPSISCALCITIMRHITPYYIHPLLTIFTLFFYLFLYDYASLIPDRCFKTFIRACCAIIYNAPLVIPVMLLVFLLDYSPMYEPLRLIIFCIFYPVLAAVITVIYSNAIHNHYELYYAE